MATNNGLRDEVTRFKRLWLLLSLDRLQGNELVMTQESIANMLSVRREGVTEGTLKLQQAGLIRYARGRITAGPNSLPRIASCSNSPRAGASSWRCAQGMSTAEIRRNRSVHAPRIRRSGRIIGCR